MRAGGFAPNYSEELCGEDGEAEGEERVDAEGEERMERSMCAAGSREMHCGATASVGM